MTALKILCKNTSNFCKQQQFSYQSFMYAHTFYPIIEVISVYRSPLNGDDRPKTVQQTRPYTELIELQCYQCDLTTFVRQPNFPWLWPEAILAAAALSQIVERLKNALINKWNNNTNKITSDLVNSIPRRLAAIIKLEGNPTKY
ncbi:hypothetical protein WN51_08666 [Melipona quadrifasciata]|uniref:Uncharacterized protein n=1 Tax=Melipona quadrifasciata TaxID=166423 RepID=A0A0M9A7N9_9HYME|nr:hypothetical protein WN51_08666 [Melipona quadrifasciata]